MPYKTLIYNIILTFCTWLAQGEPGKCRDGVTKNMAPHQILRKDLFCSYDKESYPVNDFHKNLTVHLLLCVNFFTLDELKNVLDVQGWLIIMWKDEGLMWNPADYSNVSFLTVKSYDIWQPELLVKNRGNLETNDAWDFTTCNLFSTGMVVCGPNIKLPAQCIANLYQWPFDQHNCNMIIGSQTQTRQQLDFKFIEEGINLENFTRNSEWDLLYSSSATKVVKFYNSSYQFVKYSFHIKRHADAYAATVIIPSI
ncbi:hypothetical protein J437_LFUL019554, partial [Ladona fulva]